MKKKMKRPRLGQEIESVSVLIRAKTEDPERGTDIIVNGDPVENPLIIGKWGPKRETVKGIYAGFRSISDIEHNQGYGHVKTRTFEAWIVYTSERRRPVYVLPLDVFGWDDESPEYESKTNEEKTLFQFIDQFGESMKAKIYESLAAGKFGWNTAGRASLFRWLKDEVDELEEALLDGKPEEIAGECIDVGNFAMFIWASTRGEKS